MEKGVHALASTAELCYECMYIQVQSHKPTVSRKSEQMRLRVSAG